MMFKEPRIIGCLEVAVAAFIWGSNGVIVNLIPLSSYVITFFRVFFAAMGVSIGILVSGRLHLFRVDHSLRKLIALGVLLCLGWVLLFEAMKLLPIAEAVLLNYTAPIFASVLAVVFLKEKMSKRTLVSLALSFAGIALIVLSEGSRVLNMVGSIIGLLAGLAYAIFIVLSKDALADVSNYTLVLYSNLFASAILAPSIVTIHSSLEWNVWLLLIAMGVVNTAFAVSIYFKGLKKIQAHEAAVITYLEPASAALFGLIFLGQTPSLMVAVGAVLIILGSYVTTSQYASMKK